jgi:hypothetical protein
MRGCLFVLLVGAALLAGVAWYGSPTLANAAIAAALGGSGFRAASSTITATADPPPRLLLGHADRVSITGSDVDWQALHARRLALSLDDVDLLSRTAASIRGSLDDARLDDGNGGTAAARSIRIAGPAAAATTTIQVDASAVRQAAISTAARNFGVTISDVKLAAPDRLQLVTPGATIDGRLTIGADGALALTTRLGAVPILRIDPSLPLRLTAVSVVDGGLQLTGALNVETLLGG